MEENTQQAKRSAWLPARIRRAGIWFSLALFVAGILAWGGFNTVMEWTNREEFCISCHEMKDNVYQEYRDTIHFSNRSGVRATCPDCHVPKEWTHKMWRKIQASNEVLHKILGSIDTPEKFNAKRLELARHEWDRMKRTDSREYPETNFVSRSSHRKINFTIKFVDCKCTYGIISQNNACSWHRR